MHPSPLRAAALLMVFAAPAAGRADEPAEYFEAKVRPVLVEKCVKCHGAEKQKGGLRLDSKSGWEAGGENGPAIKPGKPEDSLLIKAVRGDTGVAAMPPGGKLGPAEVAALQKWVRDGAADPRAGGPARLGGVTVAEAKKWWSFRPVVRPPVPKTKAPTNNPIDAFIVARLEAKGLSPAAAADKRTLIRRATYDLTGLPPTAEEVEAFVADESPGAYETLVNRLLASPAYGERWGRHWLDLVRYADTAGENSDHPLPHAWRYRNWVIDAFNRDMPYDEFLRDQLAGDVRAAAGPPDAYAPRVVATGFLAAPRRFGHEIEKDMHLTHEDTIDTVGKAFLGLTLGCARCHDHKYDAITAKDYYALYGIFDSTRFSFPGCEPQQQPRDLVPLDSPAEWDRVTKPYRDKLAELDARLARVRAEDANLARRLKHLSGGGKALASGEVPDGGERTFDTLPDVIEVKAGQFVRLSIAPLKSHGADSTLVEWSVAEVGGRERQWDLAADVLGDFLAANPHADRHGNPRTWWFLDGRNGSRLLPTRLRDAHGKSGLHVWQAGDTPSAFVNATKEPIAAWTKLPARSVFVHPAADGPVAVGWLSPIDGKVRITGRVKDVHPGGPDGVGWRVDQFDAELCEVLVARAKASEERLALDREGAALAAAAPRREVAYAVTEGRPHDVRMHLRGDPEKPGAVVPRRWLEVFGGEPVPATAGSGRLELAEWIAAKDNPLTARVMVNRVWLHHFGTGLVTTPNDFGTRGAAPTHPELLDWLAAEFVGSGWSVKSLHRRIMLSATYRQASSPNPAAAEIDAPNELYWRFNRRRLSAEELRDTLLAASGQLDRRPGGPHPFPPEASWGYSQHVPFGTFYESDKRSVYLIAVRNRRHPFLGLFDGADPNATTPQRQFTTVPTQALYFLNDPFFHARADQVAGRALAAPPDARLDALFRRVLQRRPTDRERRASAAFLDRYAAAVAAGPPADGGKAAWAALARVLLAGNEFLFLD